MVNELRDLMQQLVASPPEGDSDLGAVLAGGRSRVRRRRRGLTTVVAAAATVAAVAGTALVAGGGDDADDQVANRTVPHPDGPVLHLGDATPAAEGTDYDVLASYTNEDLDAANGQYYDGVTDDGLILFRDGPHGVDNSFRLALLDPATGDKDWLPAHDLGSQPQPVALGRDRLVLVTWVTDQGEGMRAVAFDRGTRRWSDLTWPDLPESANAWSAKLGPDGRLYLGVPATVGSPPPGGWPTGKDGEADDSAAEGDTYDLWSVSLDDTADVRDERLRVGSFAFADDSLVWTARTNGTNDRIHVRDLATGEEQDFDPRSGERCNVLSFGVVDDKVVLSEYCGDYDDGRDDRVQVLTTDGEPVTTIQGNGLDGYVTGGLVKVTAYAGRTAGSYVYEPDSGRFVRVSDGVSSYALGGGPLPDGYLMWDTPVGKASDPQEPIPGATQWLVRWRS